MIRPNACPPRRGRVSRLTECVKDTPLGARPHGSSRLTRLQFGQAMPRASDVHQTISDTENRGLGCQGPLAQVALCWADDRESASRWREPGRDHEADCRASVPPDRGCSVALSRAGVLLVPDISPAKQSHGQRGSRIPLGNLSENSRKKKLPRAVTLRRSVLPFVRREPSRTPGRLRGPRNGPPSRDLRATAHPLHADFASI